MRVLLLGVSTADLVAALGGHELASTNEPLDPDGLLREFRPEFIVSYGYRHLVPKSVLEEGHLKGAINLHISLLPWNRGADPNFWSWLQNTPKGVSIHWMSAQIDRGPLLAQREVLLDRNGTLASSYEQLRHAMRSLFTPAWQSVVAGRPAVVEQGLGGSYHNARERARFAGLLSRGWDTPCAEIEEYGRRTGQWLVRSTS